MNRIKKKIRKKVYINFAIIIAALLLLSFVDMIVLEKIYHPLSQKYEIPWTEFESGLFENALWWHIAFVPLGLVLFILLGTAARNWRLALSGTILFVTGWEDIFYYLIQLKKLPTELSWFDSSTFISFTKYLTGTAHVTNIGLLISAIVGLIISTFVLLNYNPLKYLNLKISHH